MKFRTIKQILIKNGFDNIKYSRSDHIKFYNRDGIHIAIPNRKDVNDVLWKRLVKENCLIIN